MSYLSIIIGFCYNKSYQGSIPNDDDDDSSLSFIRSDIESVRGLVKKGGGISAIFTDLVGEDEDEDNKVVIITSRDDLEMEILDLELNLEKRILIYYTGHGDVNSKMRLPNGDLYPLSDFRDFIAKQVDESTEILFILDCCYSGGLSLPYCLSLECGRFRLTDIDKPAIPMIMCLSSSSSEQKSIALSGGSVFTKHLISAICEGKNSLVTLSKLLLSKTTGDGISGEQTMNVHCSYPIPPVLWTWVTIPGISIYINDPMSCLIIEKV